MSERDDHVSMGDMLRYAAEATELLGESTRESLAGDRMLQLALTRLLEIVGEAAKRVSVGGQERNPEIPWSRIIGMRNRLAHGYDVIDFDLVYGTVADDLPPLIEQLESILGKG